VKTRIFLDLSKFNKVLKERQAKVHKQTKHKNRRRGKGFFLKKKEEKR